MADSKSRQSFHASLFQICDNIVADCTDIDYVLFHAFCVGTLCYENAIPQLM